MAERRYLWECQKCGLLYGGPRDACRHAEGAAARGVYYPCKRLTVEVVERATPRYVNGEWVHTPDPATDEKQSGGTR